MSPTPKQEFIGGAKAIAPVLLGSVPFAFVCGVEAVRSGLPLLESIAMNFVIFAGASQLITVQLLAENANPLIVILTAAAINLRFVMYSASLSLQLNRLPWLRRVPYAYMLSDQAYAVSIFKMEEEPENPHKHWFYFGAALTLYATWQLGSWTGALLGNAVPESWSLEFVVPLTFLAIIVPVLRTSPMIIAAIVGGATSVLMRGLPPGIGIVLGALCGIAAALAFGKEPA